jgi:hypothetical protein
MYFIAYLVLLHLGYLTASEQGRHMFEANHILDGHLRKLLAFLGYLPLSHCDGGGGGGGGANKILEQRYLEGVDAKTFRAGNLLLWGLILQW